ncbi:4a-hydroxytetrahydrobiopterin dehydratase [Streptomyces sp. JJ36]|uniref:4a-hydroxytetrahydrobiopterin dehydratase n=1 Tax=Streptomyces sp. JJ36 TaxID=2736645 RepID=UPI001F01BF20|nr:4a-hydroxytetrahydrobiopterin dehydratase [Streptomyces sp. JJ36]MCF6526501.1 4a-hydroxytetrahydrobiopterin dehydratase [Streptomyces sp. JJ36]
MAPQPLAQPEIDEALALLPGWQVEGDRLTRVYSFDKHLPAAAMALHVATIQEELNHHTDMTLSYDTLALSVNTHTVGAITELDVGLARRISEIAVAHGAR